MNTHIFKKAQKKLLLVITLSLFIFSSQVFAQTTSKLTPTDEFEGKWGTKVKEAIEAMKLAGSIEDGAIIYEEICQACHQPGGNGDPGGNFPQLAGQHSTVIIKQIADIRIGNRDNPTMYPFANIEALRAATEDIFDLYSQENDSARLIVEILVLLVIYLFSMSWVLFMVIKKGLIEEKTIVDDEEKS